MGAKLTKGAFVMVNLMCVNLTGPRDAQLLGETLFLGVLLRFFLDEISI